MEKKEQSVSFKSYEASAAYYSDLVQILQK